ncbi:MAG: nitronate monooxygenase [Roseovarius sp.]|uniref:NAD(P)H-dependent flavin oxidoreductase n=1 Tax=Roseovarius sp. TaxID=1486281 RepID=UPI001B7444FD|nr:nitronate monooxygenase [Roseovarius sp.]MBQ0751634.1 nitronate monooxygenase [Roseovarius sp.]MBQ0809783.1 nitronate monooxygenase [Roseovarius sp.]
MQTRLTEALGLTHPILCAPMAFAAGGRLAAAVTHAGGLGLIGGGYGNADWLDSAFAEAGNARVGCGFITWKMAENPAVLDLVLARAPAALCLSFGDPAPFAPRIAAAGVPLICQVQTLRDAQRAAECGARIIVAQGSEAGGHGERRGTITLVPEVADWLAGQAPEVLLLAAGGIADGRGLAAALMLGADGVLIGSRLWASAEAQVSQAMTDAAIAATGDQTIRSTVMDAARDLRWPARYTARVLRNAVTERWHDDPDALRKDAPARADWATGWAAGDPTRANTFVGEATGLIHDRPPVADIIARMVTEAEALLKRAPGWA